MKRNLTSKIEELEDFSKITFNFGSPVRDIRDKETSEISIEVYPLGEGFRVLCISNYGNERYTTQVRMVYNEIDINGVQNEARKVFRKYGRRKDKRMSGDFLGELFP